MAKTIHIHLPALLRNPVGDRKVKDAGDFTVKMHENVISNTHDVTLYNEKEAKRLDVEIDKCRKAIASSTEKTYPALNEKLRQLLGARNQFLDTKSKEGKSFKNGEPVAEYEEVNSEGRRTGVRFWRNGEGTMTADSKAKDSAQLTPGKKYRSSKGIVTYIGPDRNGRHGDILTKNASGFTVKMHEDDISGTFDAAIHLEYKGFGIDEGFGTKGLYVRKIGGGKPFGNTGPFLSVEAAKRKIDEVIRENKTTWDAKSKEELQAEIAKLSEEIEKKEDQGVSAVALVEKRKKLREELQALSK